MDYQRIYDQLIYTAKNRQKPDGYVERHHVIPVCLGGDNQTDNLVYLTAEEHYVAHQLLVKIHPCNKMLFDAACGMSASRWKRRSGNKLYGWLKRRMAVSMTENNPMFDPTIKERHRVSVTSPEYIEKQRQKSKAIIKTDTWKKNIGLSLKDRVFTKEHRSRISESKIGKIWVNDGSITKMVEPGHIPVGFKFGRLTMKRHSEREV